MLNLVLEKLGVLKTDPKSKLAYRDRSTLKKFEALAEHLNCPVSDIFEVFGQINKEQIRERFDVEIESEKELLLFWSVGCSNWEIYFQSNDSEKLKNSREEKKELEKLIRNIDNKLSPTLTRLIELTPSYESEYLQTNQEQLQALFKKLKERNDTLDNILLQTKNQGGKNKQAHLIAIRLAQVFVKLNVHVGFGKQDGQPSTKYTKAVKKALEIFKVEANFESPAKTGVKWLQSELPKKIN